ncbi:MAG: peptidylprolyl isomerase [Bacteroidales bacterium]|nr:peptidylprolyl isomerase [Bacteroidales bacterium]
MVVSSKKVVSISYELRLNSKDGTVVENVVNNSPLTFIYGSGYLLPRFEDHLAGLKTGERFDFRLSSEDAYGNFDQDSVLSIPLKSFEVDGEVDYELVKIGNTIPMQDSEGHKLTGVVKAIKDDSVTMDFNHPLAGNNLFFTGEVTDIRQATEEELIHGHVHHASDCSGCSGCGDNSEGCC